MRIAHVVTLVSQDGAFGGPVSVARAQTAELARRGHDVVLLAGWDAQAHLEIPGVEVGLYPVRRIAPVGGFAGLLAPGLLRRLRRLVPSLDVVQVHLARDLVTLGAAGLIVAKQRGGRPALVTQTHGMVMPDGRGLARAIDAVATRRILRAARVSAVLTETERDGLRAVGGERVRPLLLDNGIRVATDDRDESVLGDLPTVLFCARLHPRKRVMAFAQMARILIQDGVDARFVVAGPDEGDLGALRTFIARYGLSEHIEYIGALEPGEVRNALARAQVYVLPSEREPFPMTLLEAMAEATPAVITEGCMIASRFSGADGPLVCDGSPADLAREVGRLLSDPGEARRRGRRSRELARTQFSIGAVVDELEAIYRG